MEENQDQNIDLQNQDPVSNANNAIGKPTESDTQNLDVLLQDPKLQAEFDKSLAPWKQCRGCCPQYLTKFPMPTK